MKPCVALSIDEAKELIISRGAWLERKIATAPVFLTCSAACIDLAPDFAQVLIDTLNLTHRRHFIGYFEANVEVRRFTGRETWHYPPNEASNV